jgi:hypothetical protein
MILSPRFFLIILFFLGINNAVSQTIDLGSIENFSLFTTEGAVTNTTTSTITGDIGADIGAISGFGASVVNGSIHNTNPITAQAVLDLNAAVAQITATTTTDTYPSTHVFGNGETLTAGVHVVSTAASLNGTLTLNAQGDPNAQFIFKIGGAFSTAAHATVVLTGCASPTNIFWLAKIELHLFRGNTETRHNTKTQQKCRNQQQPFWCFFW